MYITWRAWPSIHEHSTMVDFGVHRPWSYNTNITKPIYLWILYKILLQKVVICIQYYYYYFNYLAISMHKSIKQMLYMLHIGVVLPVTSEGGQLHLGYHSTPFFCFAWNLSKLHSHTEQGFSYIYNITNMGLRIYWQLRHWL